MGVKLLFLTSILMSIILFPHVNLRFIFHRVNHVNYVALVPYISNKSYVSLITKLMYNFKHIFYIRCVPVIFNGIHYINIIGLTN